MNEQEKNVYTNLFEYPTKKIVELYQETERLKAENEDMSYKIDWLEQKLRDTNNIINEFEIFIKNKINESKFEDDYDRADSLEYCLATLQELKGEDKE